MVARRATQVCGNGRLLFHLHVATWLIFWLAEDIITWLVVSSAAPGVEGRCHFNRLIVVVCNYFAVFNITMVIDNIMKQFVFRINTPVYNIACRDATLAFRTC